MKVKFCPKNGLNLALEPPEASKWAKGPWKRTPKDPPQLPLNNLSPFEEDFVGRGFEGDDFVFFFLYLCLCICVCICLFPCLCLCERWGGLCEPRVWRRWLSERSQLLIVFQLFAQTSFYSLHLTLLHHPFPGMEEEEINKTIGDWKAGDHRIPLDHQSPYFHLKWSSNSTRPTGPIGASWKHPGKIL